MSAPLRRHTYQIRSPFVSEYQKSTLARESLRAAVVCALIVVGCVLAALVAFR